MSQSPEVLVADSQPDTQPDTQPEGDKAAKLHARDDGPGDAGPPPKRLERLKSVAASSQGSVEAPFTQKHPDDVAVVPETPRGSQEPAAAAAEEPAAAVAEECVVVAPGKASSPVPDECMVVETPAAAKEPAKEPAKVVDAPAPTKGDTGPSSTYCA